MQQSTIELTRHLGFQLSLLKLSIIPGPNGSQAPAHLRQQAEQLQQLVEEAAPVRASR